MSDACSALEEILPPSISVAASRADIPGAGLAPEEEAAVGGAVERRRREFATGRACARFALRKCGIEECPVPVGARGAPQWPAGIVGSITHCDGYRGCAVGRIDEFLAIGIDAEPNQPLPHGLLLDIALPQERVWVWRLMRRAAQVKWDRLLFCIKEAVYKAWFPLTGTQLDFGHAVVSVDPLSNSFAARLLVSGAPIGDRSLTAFHGKWLVSDGIVLTGIALPASAASIDTPAVE